MERALIVWTDFFAAQLGASAALAGLLSVGISIDMTKTVSHPHPANRALVMSSPNCSCRRCWSRSIANALEVLPGLPLHVSVEGVNGTFDVLVP